MGKSSEYVAPVTADLARELADFALRLSRSLRQQNIVGSSPLPLVEVSVLYSIYKNPGMTAAALARQHRMAPQSMRPWVVSLLEKQMIRKVPDGCDRRVQRLFITPQGKVCLKQENENHMLQLTTSITEHFTEGDQGRHLQVIRDLKILLHEEPLG